MLNANWKQEGSGKKYRLKPYWGNPAVRNFRGSGGNLGIIEAQRAPLLYSTDIFSCPFVSLRLMNVYAVKTSFFCKFF